MSLHDRRGEFPRQEPTGQELLQTPNIDLTSPESVIANSRWLSQVVEGGVLEAECERVALKARLPNTCAAAIDRMTERAIGSIGQSITAILGEIPDIPTRAAAETARLMSAQKHWRDFLKQTQIPLVGIKVAGQRLSEIQTQLNRRPGPRNK